MITEPTTLLTDYALGGLTAWLAWRSVDRCGPSNVRRWLLPLLWVQFAGYVLWMLRHNDFLYVLIEYGSALLLAILVQLANPAARRASSAHWIAAGVVITIAGAVIQQSGIDLHPYFNHNDLQHLVQMGAIGFLYKGGTTLTDRS